MIDSVVSLVGEHVDLGGSQFSGSILAATLRVLHNRMW